MENEVVCKYCATVDDYYTIEKKFKNGTVHIEAKCNNCDKHIKYLSQGGPPILYFGKYKGKDVTTIEDLFYLTWLDENVHKMSVALKRAIKDRIAELTQGST